MGLKRWVFVAGALSLLGCPLPILSRKTVVEPQPEPMCKIQGQAYVTPKPGAIDPPKRDPKTPDVKDVKVGGAGGAK